MDLPSKFSAEHHGLSFQEPGKVAEEVSQDEIIENLHHVAQCWDL